MSTSPCCRARRPGLGRAAAGLALAAAVAALAACGRAAGAGPATLRWVISAPALQRLLALPGGRALAEAAFDNPDTYVLAGAEPPAFLARWRSPIAIGADGYPALRAALAGSGPGGRIRAVVFDQEAWPFTPTGEQRDPAPYVRQAALLAHALGLTLIATPATDLAPVVAAARGSSGVPPSPAAAAPLGPAYRTFLALGIARAVAAYADVYEVQAQGAEGDVAAYRAFVEAAAAQARAGHPGIVVLAGLSTNPSGQSVAAATLYQDVLGTRDAVAGYWLNIPAGGAACPRCGEARPQVAEELLRMLYARA